MKTDITKLGKDPKTGLDMHAFRYKGDPKTYPKVVGPMAQDVEKQFPGSTAPMGKDGKLAIRGYAKGTPYVQPDAPSFDGRLGWNKALSEAPLPSWWDKRPAENSLPPPPPPRSYAAGTPFVQPSLAGFTPPSSPGVAKGIGAMSAFRPPMRLPRGATVAPMPKRFAGGIAAVPGAGSDDTVPSYLTPGEAVLTPGAAQHVGRPKIAALNAMHPPAALSTFMPPVELGAGDDHASGRRSRHQGRAVEHQAATENSGGLEWLIRGTIAPLLTSGCNVQAASTGMPGPQGAPDTQPTPGMTLKLCASVFASVFAPACSRTPERGRQCRWIPLIARR